MLRGPSLNSIETPMTSSGRSECSSTGSVCNRFQRTTQQRSLDYLLCIDTSVVSPNRNYGPNRIIGTSTLCKQLAKSPGHWPVASKRTQSDSSISPSLFILSHSIRLSRWTNAREFALPNHLAHVRLSTSQLIGHLPSGQCSPISQFDFQSIP